MKIWTYRELREETTDELLDMLSNYLHLRKNLESTIKACNETICFYNKELIVNYDLNIRKIQNELVVKSKK
jgi:hypothetical protein